MKRWGKTAGAVLSAALALAGPATAERQSSQRAERPLAVLCAVEEVRTRHWNYSARGLEDGAALTSLKRVCEAAVAASTEAKPDLVTDRPWTTLCSEAGLQRRHPNADSNLLRALRGECRGALQAAADAKQELTRCDYSSITQCMAEGCGPSVDPEPDVRWLEIPRVNETLWVNDIIARLGDGPYPLHPTMFRHAGMRPSRCGAGRGRLPPQSESTERDMVHEGFKGSANQ